MPSYTRPQRPIKIVSSLPDNDDLPEGMHDLADQWREIDSELDDAEVALDDAERALKSAPSADVAAIQAAAVAGTKLPAGTEHETAATVTAIAAAARYMDLAKRHRDLGEQVRQYVVDHAAEMRAVSTAKIAEKAKAYADAITAAVASLEPLRSELGAAIHNDGFIDEANGIGVLPFEIGPAWKLNYPEIALQIDPGQALFYLNNRIIQAIQEGPLDTWKLPRAGRYAEPATPIGG